MIANIALRRARSRSGKVLALPAHLQVEITNACNLRCATCHRDLLYPRPTTMRFSDFKTVFDATRPVKINVSGLGEPFINREIFEIVRYAKRSGASVNCATNFTLVANKIDEILASGIDQLKVSIDAATRESFLRIRKRDLHDTLVGNLTALKEKKRERGLTKPSVRFNYALQRDNIGELLDTMTLADELGVEAFYIQYLVYLDREERKGELVGDLTQEELRSVLNDAESLAREYGIVTNVEMWRRDFDLFWNNMQPAESFVPNQRPCYFPWFSAWIDADGTVRPCPIIPWQKGVACMGNAFRQPFHEIWNNREYRAFRRALARGERPTEPCRTCIPLSLSTISEIGRRLLPASG